MAKIKIINEEKYSIQYKKIRDFRILSIGLPDDQILTYMGISTLQKILRHCNEYRQKNLEAMGFLTGNVYRFHNGHFLLIHDCVTTELDSTSISVKFSKAGFKNLFTKMDLRDRQLIGWYHSHPGYFAFMSETDIDTQKKLFPEPYHLALVVDPIHYDIKGFSLVNEKIVNRIIFIHAETGKILKRRNRKPDSEDIEWMAH